MSLETILRIATWLMLVSVASVHCGCSDDLKEFQLCIEEFHANNPMEPPKPPEKPDFLKIMAKGAKCFTDNKCEDQTSSFAQKILLDMVNKPETGMDRPSRGMGHKFGGGPPTREGPGMDGWMAMKKAKWDCLSKIAQEEIVPKVEACVQVEIPDWEYPVHPDNKSDPYDPYGEGPASKHAKWMMTHMMMQQKGLEPPMLNSITAPKRSKRDAKFGRHRPGMGNMGGPMRGMMGGMNPKMIDEFLVKSLFDEGVCPKESREAVGKCLSDLQRASHNEMTSKNPGPLEMMINHYTKLDDFCQRRQTCWDKISDDCRNDFWDQKWYIARCYQQHVDSMNDDAWDGLQTKMDECLAEAGAPPADISLEEDDDDDEDEKEADSDDAVEKDKKEEDKSTIKSSQLSAEKNDSLANMGMGPDWKRKMLRKCLSRRFQDGPIKNPCRKVDGMYEFIKHHHHHGPPHHHGHHWHHNGPNFGMGHSGMMGLGHPQKMD